MTLPDLNLINFPHQNSLNCHKFSFFELKNNILSFIGVWDCFTAGFSLKLGWNLENWEVTWVFFRVHSERYHFYVKNAWDKDFSKTVCWSDCLFCLLGLKTSQWDFCTPCNIFDAECLYWGVLGFNFRRFHRVSFWHGKEFIQLFQGGILLLSWILKIQQMRITLKSYPSSRGKVLCLFPIHHRQWVVSFFQVLW